MNILFVNACIRGEESNTLKLCRTALCALRHRFPEAEVSEVNLDAERPLPLYPETVKWRSALHAAMDFRDPVFDYAHSFAAADFVLIGTPYWDLAFPAVLKIYLERVCAVDVTFGYTPEGVPFSLCKGKRLFYITTAGAEIGGYNLGYDYVKALNAQFFRFPDIDCFSVCGFDLGGDPALLVEEGESRLLRLIQSWFPEAL